ncbi:MAG: radical SAM protein [Leptospirales bacterium]
MDSVESLIKEWQEQYSDLPFEAFIKQDVLRCGLGFQKEAIDPQVAGQYKTKDYFIFSFDLVPLNSMKEGENWKAPEEIRLSGGPQSVQQTVVSVRIHPESPYQVSVLEGVMRLLYKNEYLCDVEYPPIPEYYKKKYSMDKPIGEIAPVIEWGYLIYLTVFRNCQYFGKDEECQFCDINHNWKQQKKSGRPYTGIKPIEYVLEALSGINEFDTVAKAYTLTGGSVVTNLQGKDETEFYGQYAKAIQEKFPGRWISKVVTQAFELDNVKKLKDYGVDIYHPNYEVWDSKLFDIYCPGKARYVGRDEWMKRIIDATSVFGARNVIPNFVGGVEMAGPHGIKDVDKAVESTSEGLEYFMSNGVTPRFTTWCPEPYTVLGNEKAPPLEYYMKLLRNYKRLMEKYKLPAPPGYGPAGVGKAVFSVSAFMDVLRE